MSCLFQFSIFGNSGSADYDQRKCNQYLQPCGIELSINSQRTFHFYMGGGQQYQRDW
jgi:hypothetical protein